MANTNKVNGFRPVRYLSGAPWNGQANKYVIPAGNTVATFVGDLVKLDTTGTDEGHPTVAQAAASDAVVGVIVGMEVVPGSLDTPQYRAASTKRVVWVADDPNLILEAQEDGDTDPLETANIGLNVNFVVGSGSTVTGASGMQIDSNTEATTAALPLKLLRFVERQDNENVLSAGGQSYSRWEVKINNHQMLGGTGTVGV